ncbi:MAG: hypothetical protein HFG67_00855 [Firmicutes bacterium]|nr:hypothetical protein [Bacillota bacterium]
MTEDERKAIADNISDSLFFAADDIRDMIIKNIEKKDEKLAEIIKANIIFC